jgi:hypothetical protein
VSGSTKAVEQFAARAEVLATDPDIRRLAADGKLKAITGPEAP